MAGHFKVIFAERPGVLTKGTVPAEINSPDKIIVQWRDIKWLDGTTWEGVGESTWEKIR